MQFTVPNNGTKWTEDFCLDSVVLSVKDLNENLTIISQETPLTAWFVAVPNTRIYDNHLPRDAITPNQQGTIEMREELLFSVGAQDKDRRGYELSDLEDIELSWEDPAVDMDGVYRPGIDTPFSRTFLTIFRWGQPLPTQK